MANPRGFQQHSGEGAGRGIPGGQRRGRNTEPCPDSGPGYGQGGGRGGGLIRADLSQATEKGFSLLAIGGCIAGGYILARALGIIK